MFEELCSWMENGECELLTLAELGEKAVSIGNCSDFYLLTWLKKKLLERYGDHIVFAEINGRKNVICWRKMALYIVNTQWYDERKSNIDDDSERIVTTAAKLLKAAIRESTYTKNIYPSSTEYYKFH